MLKEFKAFVNQGNALDLAVGVIIGAAFGKIVNSIVTDVIMPLLSIGLGRVDFKNMYVPLAGQARRHGHRGGEEGRVRRRLRTVLQHRDRVSRDRVHDLPARAADQQVAGDSAGENVTS